MKRTLFHMCAVLLVLAACVCAKPEDAAYRAYHFNEEVRGVTLCSDEAALAEAVREAMRRTGRPVPDLDHRLVAAARNHNLSILEEGGDFSGSVSAERVQKAMLEAGGTDANFSVQVIRAGTLGPILDAVGPVVEKGLSEEPYTHFGVGVVRRRFPPLKAAAFLFVKRFVALDLFPRFVPEATESWLTGTLLPGAREPSVFITTPSGKIIESLPRAGAGGAFRSLLRFDPEQPGRYMVEVEVNGESGPQIAALFPVDFLKKSLEGRTFLSASGSAASGAARSVESPMSAKKAEELLVKLINKERKARRLIPLVIDDRLAQMARAHSTDMRDNDFVSHVSPSSGEAVQRVEKWGIRYTRLTENVATNATIRGAHASLMQSPAHRRNILDAKVYYVGVGVAVKKIEGRIQYYITENFLDTR